MFTAQQQYSIGLELANLSIAHGWKKLNENEQLFFIEQMEKWHRSPDDIIKAIKNLFDVPMTTLNLPRIREALALIITPALPEQSEAYYHSPEYKQLSRRVFGRTALLKKIHGKKWFHFYKNDVEAKPLTAEDEKYYEGDYTIAELCDGKTMAADGAK
jgi:hypothetical protein